MVLAVSARTITAVHTGSATIAKESRQSATAMVPKQSRRHLLGVGLAAAVTLISTPAAHAIKLPQSETGGNRGVRFSGSARESEKRNRARQEAMKERVEKLKAEATTTGGATPSSSPE